jgi:hypothetical protein
MPVDPIGTTISAVRAYKTIQDVVEVSKENVRKYDELRSTCLNVARLIKGCVNMGFGCNDPDLQKAYASHMEDTAATLIDARNTWYDYLLMSK